MKLNYYLRGLGIGITVTALLMGITAKPRELTDEQIRLRAQKLGMVDSSNQTLANDPNMSSSEKKDKNEMVTPVNATPAQLPPAGDLAGEDGQAVSGNNEGELSENAVGKAAELKENTSSLSDSENSKSDSNSAVKADSEKSTSASTAKTDSTKPTNATTAKADGTKSANATTAKTDSTKPANATTAKTDSTKPANASTAKADSTKSANATTAKADSTKSANATTAKTDSTKPANATTAKTDAAKKSSSSSSELKVEKNDKLVTITITGGQSSTSVAAACEKAGLVKSAKEFDKFLCDNGYDRRITTGKKNIPVGASMVEIAGILTVR